MFKVVLLVVFNSQQKAWIIQEDVMYLFTGSFIISYGANLRDRSIGDGDSRDH